MISKQQLLESLLSELKVVKHLAGEIPLGGLDYRPTPSQRSTLETMQYLSFCASGVIKMMLDGNWDRYKAGAEAAAALTVDELPKAFDAQARELEQLFNEMSHKDLQEKQIAMPWGDTYSLGQAILNTALKWLVGYRMQLFLYAKAAGNAEIGTWDCWRGKSAPKD